MHKSPNRLCAVSLIKMELCLVLTEAPSLSLSLFFPLLLLCSMNENVLMHLAWSMNVKEQKASWKCILFHARFSFAATYFESIYYVYLKQRSIYMTQMHSILIPSALICTPLLALWCVLSKINILNACLKACLWIAFVNRTHQYKSFVSMTFFNIVPYFISH